MNIAEAARIDSVLGEALQGLKLMRLVTEDVLERAEEMVPVVGQNVVECFKMHRARLEDARGDVADEKLNESTMALYRALRDTPQAVAYLQAKAATPAAEEHVVEGEEGADVQRALEETSRRSAMDGVIAYFTQLKAIVKRRLSTTVEEEASSVAHFEEVRQREEKAAKELQALEQQLKLERAERSKQLAQANEREQNVQSELETLRANTEARMQQLDADARAQRESDKLKYEEREAQLVKEIEVLTKELDELLKGNLEEEAALRKKKNKGEQEVAAIIEQYDKDMGSREKSYQEEKAVYIEVQKQLREYEEHYEQLRAEAEEIAAEQRRLEQIKEEEERHQKALDDAALKIQGMWKQHKATKEAETSGKKKGKGKGKKK